MKLTVTDSRGEPFKECPHPDIYDRGECCGGECVYPRPSLQGGAEPWQPGGIVEFTGNGVVDTHSIGETGGTDELSAELRLRIGKWIMHDDRLTSDGRLFKRALEALTSLRAERDALKIACEQSDAETEMWASSSRQDELARKAAESSLAAEKLKVAELAAERDEAVNWNDLVERHGTDQFDDLAEAWLALEAIQRVTNAATSTFAKWANDDLMARFRKQQLSMFHMAFVEGSLAGVKAEKAKSDQRVAALVGALKSENAAIADYLRYCAGNYSESSDGRNTFVMAASWVEARATEA